MVENEVTEAIIACAIEVHRELGPGLLESIYQLALEVELRARGLAFSSQSAVPVYYKGKRLGSDLRLDLLIAESVIVEVKAVERLDDTHTAQLLTYLRLGNKRLGLLLNFNAVLLTKGIKRVINSKSSA